MNPTQVLSDEHRVIEVVLASLEALAEESLKERKLDRESALQAIDFIKTFADGCHHGKEETHLFPMMVRRGAPKEGGPVGVMLHEHELGRSYVREMSQNVEAASQGNSTALMAFVANARAYIGLLRAHIMKEDQILFPMAGRIMNDKDNESLVASFETVEKDHMGVGTHERYLNIAAELAAKYNVSKEPVEKILESNSCACGHKK